MNTAPPILPNPDGPAPGLAQPAPTSGAAAPKRPSLRWLAVFAFIYLYSFPYFEKLWNANEVPRVFLTQEIVDRHHLWIDARLSSDGRAHALDVSIAPDRHTYPNKAPGLSFLAVPVYAAARLFGHPSLRACTWLFRVLVVTVPSLVFLPFFLGMARRFAPDERACRTVLVAYALGSPALVYGVLFMSHQLAAACAGGAFLAAVALARRRTTRPFLVALLAGFLAGVSVLVEYQSLLTVLVIGIYFAVRVPNRVRAMGAALLGALPPAVVLAGYHKLAFGSPFKSGYTFAVENTLHKGFLGVVGPSAKCFWTTLFLPSNGLFALVPWTLLAAIGAVAVARDREARARCGAETVVCVAVLAVNVALLGSLDPYMSRGGWSVGPRYLTAALPFVAWLAAAGFHAVERSAPARVLAQALVVSSAVVFVTAATTYPHWPDELRNPLYELAFPLLTHGYAVHSLGTLVGLHGFLSIAPLYAVALGAAIWLLSRGPMRSLRQTALACILAAGLVAGYRAVPLTGAYAGRVWAFVTATWEPPLK
ncbi:MAG TPA: hypothetical protein VJ801_04155 [Polyangia bacterium]|nr:hypothetical protein [Polyangia bacterium]